MELGDTSSIRIKEDISGDDLFIVYGSKANYVRASSFAAFLGITPETLLALVNSVIADSDSVTTAQLNSALENYATVADLAGYQATNDAAITAIQDNLAQVAASIPTDYLTASDLDAINASISTINDKLYGYTPEAPPGFPTPPPVPGLIERVDTIESNYVSRLYVDNAAVLRAPEISVQYHGLLREDQAWVRIEAAGDVTITPPAYPNAAVGLSIRLTVVPNGHVITWDASIDKFKGGSAPATIEPENVFIIEQRAPAQWTLYNVGGIG